MQRPVSFSVLLSAALLAACGGGGGSSAPPAAPPTMHSVTISWLPNREAAINSPGGGYIVRISGQPAINCPFGLPSPCLSPTSVQVTLLTGTYSATVVAYSALNAPGGSGSTSAPSVPLVVNVP